MRSPDGRPLISIGITYRKDVYPYGEVRTMEQFLQAVGREHEVVAELTRSGSVVGTNSYSSYMWECRQRYSPDRWYILGDAADTVDPLYSVGMALASVQIRQIEAMIARELDGYDTREFTNELDKAVTAFQRSVTRDTTRLYECMGDAYQCHLRVRLAVTKLFHLGLPLLLNSYPLDPLGVKLLNRFANLETLEAASRSFQELIGQVAANPKNRALVNFTKVQSAESMNYSFYEYFREEDIPASLAHMLFILARLRIQLLTRLSWRERMSFRQNREWISDILRGLVLRVLFHRVKLRESALVRRMFPVSERRVKPMPDEAAQKQAA